MNAEDIFKKCCHRNTVSLFKGFLVMLEDLHKEHQINFDKLRYNLPEGCLPANSTGFAHAVTVEEDAFAVHACMDVRPRRAWRAAQRSWAVPFLQSKNSPPFPGSPPKIVCATDETLYTHGSLFPSATAVTGNVIESCLYCNKGFRKFHCALRDLLRAV